MRILRVPLAAAAVALALLVSPSADAAVQVSIPNPDGSTCTYAKLVQVIYADPAFGSGSTQLRYLCFASAQAWVHGGPGAAQNASSLAANIVVPSSGLISTATGIETPEQVFDALAIAATVPSPSGTPLPGPLAAGTVVP